MERQEPDQGQTHIKQHQPTNKSERRIFFWWCGVWCVVEPSAWSHWSHKTRPKDTHPLSSVHGAKAARRSVPYLTPNSHYFKALVAHKLTTPTKLQPNRLETTIFHSNSFYASLMRTMASISTMVSKGKALVPIAERA